MAKPLSYFAPAFMAVVMALSPYADASPRPSAPDGANDDGGCLAGTDDEADARDRVLMGGPTGKLGPQRGDFVPPDMLLIAYENAWLGTVEAVAREAMPSTDVYVMVDPQDVHEQALVDWARTLGVTLLGLELDTPWVRDYGPLQRLAGQGRVVWLDFDYGPERRLDDEVPLSLVSRFGVPVERSSFSLDGGALVSNGSGLCAMTDRSLEEAGVDFNDDEAVESLLGTLGCEVMAALPDLPDEPTGHADMMVQFVARDRAMVIELDAADHPDEALLLDMAARAITLAARAAGQSLKIIRIPAAYDDGDGTLFSYVNGTRLRDRYLSPSFTAVEPALAYRADSALRSAMPGVTIVPIPSDDVLSSAGILHCITLGLSLPSARNH